MNDRIKKKRNKKWFLDVYVIGGIKRCTATYKSERIRRLSERVLQSLGARKGIIT